jgi:hypothetical protein
MKEVIIIEHYQGRTSVSVVAEDVDLEDCFKTWKVDFHQALKRQVIKANPTKSNREIALIMTSAGIYSKHANLVDVEIQVGKIRRKLKEAKNGS